MDAAARIKPDRSKVFDRARIEDVVDKVKAAARARVRPAPGLAIGPSANDNDFRHNGKVLAVGSSTGGVEALLTIVSRLPADAAPTVITQHMPATFTKSFAERLNRASPATVTQACDGDVLRPGHIYLAPGDAHLEVEGSSALRCKLSHGAPVSGHCPSVDVLFNSIARTAKSNAVGVILTGMGRDGAVGLAAMRAAGARTLGQDEASCVVYGMPRAAIELGAVERQLPLDKIPAAIRNLTNQQGER
jgi:two-component system chemotaxis response regulator CheB